MTLLGQQKSPYEIVGAFCHSKQMDNKEMMISD